jgi:hypothetical protein
VTSTRLIPNPPAALTALKIISVDAGQSLISQQSVQAMPRRLPSIKQEAPVMLVDDNGGVAIRVSSSTQF